MFATHLSLVVRRVASGSAALAVMAGAITISTPVYAMAPAAAADPDLAKAEQLYDEGVAAYETHDYEGAAAKWTQSYAALPEGAAGPRNQMVYNIATAQERAYDVDKDVQHLRQARMLLASYVDNYKKMYEKTPETKAEVGRANDRIRQLDDRIAAAEAGNPGSGRDDAPTNFSFSSGHDPPVDKERLAHNRMLATQSTKADHLIIAGWAVGGTGLLFALAGAGTMAGGQRAENRNATYGGVGALALGAAGLAAGGALLGVGFTRKKRIQRGELSLAPVAGPGTAGLVVGGRF